MCDFHSILGVAIGDKYEIRHTPDNSHFNMAAELKNQPNRKCIMFEAEWDGAGELPSDSKLIRNIGECPERLVKKIRDHYIKLKAAITEGKHFDLYFADTAKYCDVWNKAIEKGVAVVLPPVFRGYLSVYGTAKLDAPALTEVGGYLSVSGTAKLDALTEVGGDLSVSGTAKLDVPALTEVGGYLYVYGTAKLDAPKLKRKQ